uniref:Uncharacterized protein n=1 Tax=Caenorhabditis japonica TaxID=281687 RepID=A0A8R1EN59_CAEJA
MMNDIFSDDDEEYEAFREQLYDGAAFDDDQVLVPMFGGFYAIHNKSNVAKPRQDLFLLNLEAPTNDLDPYKMGSLKTITPQIKVNNLFLFFG